MESTPDAGAAVHLHPTDVDAREHAEVRRAEHGAGAEHDLARSDVATGAAHVVARLRLLLHEHAVVAVALGELDDDDRVGAVGHRRAGHDADRLAVADGRPWARDPPGSSPDHPEANRRVGRGAGGALRPHRVPVHRGVRERRDRTGRRDVGREHEPERFVRRHLDRLEAIDRGEDAGPDLAELDHESPRVRTSSARYLARSGPRSSRASASSMLAWRNPGTLPMS